MAWLRRGEPAALLCSRRSGFDARARRCGRPRRRGRGGRREPSRLRLRRSPARRRACRRDALHARTRRGSRRAAAVLESIERSRGGCSPRPRPRRGHRADHEGRALPRGVPSSRATPSSSASWPAATGEAAATPVMMIWSQILAVVPVTIHMPLCRGSSPPERGARSSRRAAIVAGDLAARFGIARSPPRRLRASTLMPARTARWATRRSASSRPPSRGCRAAGIDARRPASRRHDVPRARAPDL